MVIRCLTEELSLINDIDKHSYCPGGPDSDFEYSTQSYTGYEVSFMSSHSIQQEEERKLIILITTAHIDESHQGQV